MNYEFVVIHPLVPTSLFAETLVLSDPVQGIRASRSTTVGFERGLTAAGVGGPITAQLQYGHSVAITQTLTHPITRTSMPRRQNGVTCHDPCTGIRRRLTVFPHWCSMGGVGVPGEGQMPLEY
jgi:hypothetical protein